MQVNSAWICSADSRWDLSRVSQGMHWPQGVHAATSLVSAMILCPKREGEDRYDRKACRVTGVVALMMVRRHLQLHVSWERWAWRLVSTF
jgi:hypothetical protein